MWPRYREIVHMTVELDDAVMSAVRSKAFAEGVSLGDAITALIRLGLSAPVVPTQSNGLPILDARPGHIITDEMVTAWSES